MSAFLFVMTVLAASALVAIWPLLCLPRVRTALFGAAGGASIMLGGALFFSAVVALPGISKPALADDKPAAPEAAATSATTSTASATLTTEGEASKEASAETKPDANSTATTKWTGEPSADEPRISGKTEVIIPPGRPAWIDAEPDYTTDAHTVYVCSEPFVKRSEADRALDKAIVEATNNYVVEHLGNPRAKTLLRYDAKTIRRRFLKPEHLYHEVITVSVGPMHQAHALLEFGPKFRADLETRWAKVQGASRLMQAGLFSGVALLLLTTLSGYFRVEQATRRGYSRRLQFATAAAILAVIGAGAVLAQWIDWL